MQILDILNQLKFQFPLLLLLNLLFRLPLPCWAFQQSSKTLGVRAMVRPTVTTDVKALNQVQFKKKKLSLSTGHGIGIRDM